MIHKNHFVIQNNTRSLQETPTDLQYQLKWTWRLEALPFALKIIKRFSFAEISANMRALFEIDQFVSFYMPH